MRSIETQDEEEWLPRGANYCTRNGEKCVPGKKSPEIAVDRALVAIKNTEGSS